MSIVVRYAPVPSSTLEQYDEVKRRLQESGEMPADGFDYHVASLSDGQQHHQALSASGFGVGTRPPSVPDGGTGQIRKRKAADIGSTRSISSGDASIRASSPWRSSG